MYLGGATPDELREMFAFVVAKIDGGDTACPSDTGLDPVVVAAIDQYAAGTISRADAEAVLEANLGR